MKKYDEDIVYFISYAKLPANTPAANLHSFVGCGLFINTKTEIVEDISCTLITEEARIFLKDLIVGHKIDEEGIETLINKVKLRYHGFAQKAICVTLKDTYNRYVDWKSNL